MPTRRQFGAAVVLCLSFAFAGPAAADSAVVAVAANFAGAAEEIATRFMTHTGHRIEITTGSTGKLYAQVKEGAPFDVLLSADSKTPEKLEMEGDAVAGSRFTYAIGRLVLWSADEGRISGDPKAALTASDVTGIAIANPELAPYGVAARQALERLGLWDALEEKIVFGQNVGQTHALVDTGAAQLGFVALSAVLGPEGNDRGSNWEVPQEYFDPIRQDAVLLRHGSSNPAAVAFLDFLQGEEARKIASSFGYDAD